MNSVDDNILIANFWKRAMKAEIEMNEQIKSFSPQNDFVTKNELKIALFEFADKYKLDLINLKMTLILWGMTALLGGMVSGFGFVLKILFDISKALPK